MASIHAKTSSVPFLLLYILEMVLRKLTFFTGKGPGGGMGQNLSLGEDQDLFVIKERTRIFPSIERAVGQNHSQGEKKKLVTGHHNFRAHDFQKQDIPYP